jgi:hypothetical protein
MQRGCFIVLALLAVLAAIVGVVILTAPSRESLSQVRARIPIVGEVASFDEFVGEPIPDSENALYHYRQAWIRLDERPNPTASDNRLAKLAGKQRHRLLSDPEVLADVRAYLDEARPALDIIWETRNLSTAHFGLTAQKMPPATLPHLSRMRNLARYACAQALVAAIDGETEAAYDWIQASLHIGTIARQDPVLISHLVGAAITRLTLGTAESVMNLHDTPVPLSDALLGELELVRGREQYARVLAGEFLFSEVMTQQQGLTPNAGPVQAFIFGPDTKARYDFFSDLITAAQQPAYESRAVRDRWNEAIDTMSFRMATTRILIPAMLRSSQSQDEMSAEADLFELACAVRALAVANGRYPEALAELAPDYLEAVLLDPFSGKPYRYLLQDGTATIYSIGRNEVDDLGVEDVKTGDITWVLQSLGSHERAQDPVDEVKAGDELDTGEDGEHNDDAVKGGLGDAVVHPVAEEGTEGDEGNEVQVE